MKTGDKVRICISAGGGKGVVKSVYGQSVIVEIDGKDYCYHKSNVATL